ncbi:hypothetical protein BRO54_3554 [Geobacillus proteiniphilus]|uniref:Uncharacterized protein n=2 Tax=Geobacillus TaxID=129337 RepID=A0A1Q5SLK6_9BACL|nr:hypothetical protein BRO54_3554 [Geobacillus proteiniphilus]
MDARLYARKECDRFYDPYAESYFKWFWRLKRFLHRSLSLEKERVQVPSCFILSAACF